MHSTRQTSKQASQDRSDKAQWEKVCEVAYKMGSILYKEVKDFDLKLLKFKSADDVADGINKLMGCLSVSGRQIADGVRAGIIGSKPKNRKGRKAQTPEDDISDLFNLLFSANTIDQVNCSAQRMNRSQQMSAIGSILNEKRQKDGHSEMNDSSFFRSHILPKLDQKSLVSKTDKRDLLCILWLTYEQ